MAKNNRSNGNIDGSNVVTTEVEEKNAHTSELDLAATMDAPDSAINAIPKDTGWAWMCCLGCFIVSAIGTGGVLKCFNILYVAFMEDFNAKAGRAAWTIVLCYAVCYLGASFGSALSVHFNSRVVVVTGGLLFCGGFVSSMFATQVDHLFLTYGLLLGLGCALTVNVSVAHMGMYFKKRRGVANGIAFSGVGVGSFILPVVYRWLLDTYGLRGTLLLMGGISLHVCVAGMLFRPPSAYIRKVKSGYDCTNCEEDTKQHHDKSKPQKSLFLRVLLGPFKFCGTVWTMYRSLEWSLLKNLPFVLAEGSFFFFGVGVPTYFMSIPAHTEQIGYSKTQAALIVSLGGLAELIARFGSGFVVDYSRVPTDALLAFVAFTAALSAAVTPFITSIIPLGTAYFTFSLSVGPMMALNAVLVGESLGVHRLPSAMGILGVFVGFGTLLSSPVGGTLKDITGNWRTTFYYSSTMMVFMAITLTLRCLVASAAKKKAKSQGLATDVKC